MVLERDVKRDFLKRWDGWYDTFEPARGSGTGHPDCQLVIVKPNWILPLEFKRGSIVKGNLTVEEIRPAQISWHTRFGIAGNMSAFSVGIKDGKDIRHILFHAKHMLDGYRLNQFVVGVNCQMLPKDDNFSNEVRNFLWRGLSKK